MDRRAHEQHHHYSQQRHSRRDQKRQVESAGQVEQQCCKEGAHQLGDGLQRSQEPQETP